MKYEVIDNFLPAEEHKKIHDLLMGNEFPWFYMNEISAKGVESKDYLMYFIHLFYFSDVPQSRQFNNIVPLLNKLDIKSLIRVKANFYPNQRRNTPLDEPHTDFPYQHKGAIYSVNTCNGGTILEDGTLIDSVANRLLLFDASKPHDSKSTDNAKARVNININYF